MNEPQHERRHQPGGGYQGDDRRKPDPMKQMPGGNPSGPQSGNEPPTTPADRKREEKRLKEGD
jgi:hypothetical protein